ncbi:hypothetical protein K469DRAFT_632388 [Zopfia rhizophila CBS 207.26]|uniref:Uncharacterized protein n=1 Tax=Zopfia rhizophila CBS 207.26 TaxID=1314779 RepID=A0A6A6DZY6_9PEZI|nr:hypothetical protein K469DRAFT_632388 [Zopfia rhizophila CBS 207.26]
MAYSYDSRYHHSRRPDSYYSRSRDLDGYSSLNGGGYSYAYEPRYSSSAANPPLPKRSSANPPRRETRNKYRWPPSPSVEDEAESLAREFPSSAPSVDDEASGEAKSPGCVDQYPLLEEIEQPNDERRFVLVSDPSVAPGPTLTSSSTAKDGRRKSFAERGNMPHLKTDINDPPVITNRTPSPYAYTKPTKESISPSMGDYFLSPETITPTASSIPQSISTRDIWDSSRDQNARPSKPVHGRNDSVTQSPRTSKTDVFDDSDIEAEDAARLRTERRPARYSFVKSDLRKEDLRTSLHDTTKDKREVKQPPPQSSSRSTYNGSYSGSSHSSKNSSPPPQSPRSSSLSLNTSSAPRPKPLNRHIPAETSYIKSSRNYPDSRSASPFRPNSPLSRERPPSPPRSPKLPPRRLNDSQTPPRPSSREGNSKPPSPLSSSTSLPSQLHPRVPITETERHATYPPTTNLRPTSRYSRYETMPVPIPPRIDVQSPSPARPPKPENPLPYPVDDRPIDVFMPPEEAFQYDHSFAATPPSPSVRQSYPESPRLSSDIIDSPRDRSSAFRPSIGSRHTAAEEVPRLARVRSNSVRSQSSNDVRRKERKTNSLSLNRPLPSCPRSKATDRYDDWFTLENCPNFDICPSCFEAVFADTLFAPFFQQTRRYERPIARICDFSSPWMRLAWLLTIKQQRKSPDLLYALATITEIERPCPEDQELAGPWYGIPDQRDGKHVTNFTICPCDLKQIEALFPSLRGYFTRLPTSDPMRISKLQTCSLRVTSRRFPKYLDLLVELDIESRERSRAPDIERFIQMAREYAYKGECAKDKSSIRKPWHFIPSLPEFTICEECYDDVVWPALQQGSQLAKMFNRTIQLVPGEDSEGTSCCLYSPRMRRVWAIASDDEDFGYLKRKAVERKRAESKLAREKAGLMRMLEQRSGYENTDRLKREIKEVEAEWSGWE